MKKSLVIFLAVVMIFAMSVSALAFTDDNKISDKEAAGVMEGIGVLNGYTDGSFRPEGSLSRAEAAKMLYVLFNGVDDKATAYAGRTYFTDVPSSHWAAGYIAWGYSEGIIAGIGEGKFAPESKLTGTQLAKLILCALGYDQNTEGYLGNGWAANVLNRARHLFGYGPNESHYISLFADTPSNFAASAVCERQNAARIMLNALFACQVSYEGGVQVDSNGVKVTVNAQLVDEHEVLLDTVWDKLDYDENGYDGFGAPGATWAYDPADFEETYALPADYTFVASKTFGTVQLAVTDYKSGLTVTTAKINNNTETGSDDVLAGDIVSYYKDGQIAIVARYAPAEITAVKALGNGSTDKEKKEDGAAKKLNIKLITAGTTYSNQYDIDLANYDAETYVEDAIIMVAAKDNTTIIDTYVPTTKKGAVTAVASDYLRLDGTKYSLSGVYDKDFSDYDLKSGKYALYVDANGYAAYCQMLEGNDAIADVWFVARLFDGYGTYGSFEKAELVNMAGEVKVIEVASGSTGAAGKFVTIAEDDDDTYKMTVVPTSPAFDTDYYVNQTAYTNLTANSAQLDSSKTTFDFSGSGATLFLGKDTKYITVQTTNSGSKVNVYDSIKLTPDGGTPKYSVIYVVSGGQNVAAYVVYLASEKPALDSDTAADYFYLGTDYAVETLNKGQIVDAYDSEGAEIQIEITNETISQAKGFFKHTAEEPYKLTFVEAGTFAAGAAWTDAVKGVYYGAEVTGVIPASNLISVKFGAQTYTNIKAGAAKIVDLREDWDDESTSSYIEEINSLSQLNKALTKTYGTAHHNVVNIDINITKDGAVAIFVLDVVKTSN